MKPLLTLLLLAFSALAQYSITPNPGDLVKVGVSAQNLQAGQPYVLTTTSASGTTYTETGNPTLTAYTKDQVLTWDVGATGCTAGAVTINIDSLGAKSVKEADGATDPITADCPANQIVRIAYDGTLFRIVGGGGPLGANVVVNNAVNTGTAAMTLNVSASTTANAFRVPVGAGLTAGADGVIAYDSTSATTRVRTNGADSLICASTSTDTTTTHAMFATAVAGVCNTRAIATGDLPATLSATSITFGIANNSPVGTTVNQLAVINSSGAATKASHTTNLAQPVYIVASGAGNTGTAQLGSAGTFACQTDAGGIAAGGNFVIMSTATDGRCKDGGSTYPTSQFVVGVALAAAGANANVNVAVYNTGAIPTGTTGTGSTVLATTPTFVTNISVPIIKPAADGTSAVQVTKANGSTPLMWFDTTNGQVGVGPSVVALGSLFTAAWAQNGTTQIQIANTTQGTGSKAIYSLVSEVATGNVACYSSTTTAIGALIANSCSFQTDGAGGMALMANNASGIITFSVGGTAEKARFSATGCLEVNMTSCGTSGVMNTTGRVYHTSLTTAAANQTDALCMNASNEVIEDTVTCIASSIRFKERINPLPSMLATVMAMRPVSFFYKATGNPTWDANHSTEQVGFIAEESADPRVVITGNDGLPRAFAYENYTAILTKAMQEQQNIIQELRDRIARLEGRQ